jgi:hypothetical protein
MTPHLYLVSQLARDHHRQLLAQASQRRDRRHRLLPDGWVPASSLAGPAFSRYQARPEGPAASERQALATAGH